jgi:hypothetical protein
MKSQPFYVTLDATGNGQVQFTARKAAVKVTVRKVTIEMDPTSSGNANLYKNGGFVTSMPVTSTMEAYGSEVLYTSEYMTGEIVGGPSSTLVKWVFYYDEESVNP